jgi:hypothetical protein
MAPGVGFPLLLLAQSASITSAESRVVDVTPELLQVVRAQAEFFQEEALRNVACQSAKAEDTVCRAQNERLRLSREKLEQTTASVHTTFTKCANSIAAYWSHDAASKEVRALVKGLPDDEGGRALAAKYINIAIELEDVALEANATFQVKGCSIAKNH